MPYKDPTSPAAIESLKRRTRKYEESHREERREQKRQRYWKDPEAAIERNKAFKEKLLSERRCVRCGKISDHKSLCLVCVPKQAEASREWLVRLKQEVFNRYGGCRCACCGETIIQMLTIDHINGDGAAHRRDLRGGDGYSGGGGGRTYSWLKKNGYPSGYRVLCFNCNACFGMFGHCPHHPPGG